MPTSKESMRIPTSQFPQWLLSSYRSHLAGFQGWMEKWPTSLPFEWVLLSPLTHRRVTNLFNFVSGCYCLEWSDICCWRAINTGKGDVGNLEHSAQHGYNIVALTRLCGIWHCCLIRAPFEKSKALSISSADKRWSSIFTCVELRIAWRNDYRAILGHFRVVHLVFMIPSHAI